MNIVNKRIDELIPYEKNPRKNDEAVKYVAESIKAFGFKVPIVIDKNNVIVAGHTRYKASKKLKLTEVPCIVADDLTDEQIKAYRLADNKVAEKADWDFELLDSELDELFDFDMTLFGFEDDTKEDFTLDGLDAEPNDDNVYTINIRFDNHNDFDKCKSQIEPIVENFGGRLSVRME